MKTAVYFITATQEDVIVVERTRLVLRDPSGDKQEYLGLFSFSNGMLDWQGSSLDGFRQYKNNTLYWSTDSLGISGSKYHEFAAFNDGSGLLNYALRGNDSITGSPQTDVLSGGTGRDVLTGRGGSDQLSGGADADIFSYKSVADSRAVKESRDTIVDFNGSSGDKIDLSQIDAYSATPLNDTFIYIGSKEFSGKTGEVRFSGGILQANTGTDKRADLEIVLTGVSVITSNQLML